MTKDKKIKKEMKKIKDEVIACKKCSLCKTRTYPVIGEGNHWAKIVFVGEAPGYNEDKTGRPFCGAAGKVLDKLLVSAGLDRKQIYICNVLKCRPPGNRDPVQKEIKACSPYLEKQIKAINPEVICTLGNYSTKFIFEKYGLGAKIQGISKIHGEIYSAKDIKIMPVYHPAVATYNTNMLKVLEKDFQKLKKFK